MGEQPLSRRAEERGLERRESQAEVPAPRQAAANPTPTPLNTPPHPLPLVWCCQQRHVPGWAAPWGSADVALPLAHEESLPGGDLTDATHAAGAPICLLWGFSAPAGLQAWGLGSEQLPPPSSSPAGVEM